MSAVPRILVFVVLFASVSPAQPRPDFSGHWVLNRHESTLPPPVSNVASGVVHIEHNEPEFRFHRIYVIEGTSRDVDFAIHTDGVEQTLKAPQGVSTTGTLRWDGAALQLSMRISGTGFSATNDVRYELLDGGRRLRATEVARSNQGNHDAVWIYDRR